MRPPATTAPEPSATLNVPLARRRESRCAVEARPVGTPAWSRRMRATPAVEARVTAAWPRLPAQATSVVARTTTAAAVARGRRGDIRADVSRRQAGIRRSRTAWQPTPTAPQQRLQEALIPPVQSRPRGPGQHVPRPAGGAGGLRRSDGTARAGRASGPARTRRVLRPVAGRAGRRRGGLRNAPGRAGAPGHGPSRRAGPRHPRRPARPGPARPPAALVSHKLPIAFCVVVLVVLLLVQGATTRVIGQSGTVDTVSGAAPLAGQRPILDAGVGGLVSHQPVPGRDVALTFDDGPDPRYTPQIASILERYHAPATFFEVGGQMVRHPGIVRRLVRDGFEIGNHTFTHADLTALPTIERNAEVDLVQSALAGITGMRTRLLRPPYSSTTDAVTPRQDQVWGQIAHRGYQVVLS